jgi:hypothetical protein
MLTKLLVIVLLLFAFFPDSMFHQEGFNDEVKAKARMIKANESLFSGPYAVMKNNIPWADPVIYADMKKSINGGVSPTIESVEKMLSH